MVDLFEFTSCSTVGVSNKKGGEWGRKNEKKNL